MGGKARCPGHPLELGGRTAVYKWGLRAEGPRPLTDCGYGSLACGRWLRGPHLETWDTVPAEGLRLSARVPSVSSPEGSPSPLCILPQTHLILKTGPPTRPAWGRGPPPLTPPTPHCLGGTYLRRSGCFGWLGSDVCLRDHPTPQRGLQQPDGGSQPQHGCRAELLGRVKFRACTRCALWSLELFIARGGSCSCPLLSRGLAEGSLLGTGRERASDQQLQAQTLLWLLRGFRLLAFREDWPLERTFTSLWGRSSTKKPDQRSWFEKARREGDII